MRNDTERTYRDSNKHKIQPKKENSKNENEMKKRIRERKKKKLCDFSMCWFDRWPKIKTEYQNENITLSQPHRNVKHIHAARGQRGK